jgi:hypothetical protein
MSERFVEITIRLPGDLFKWTTKFTEFENVRRENSNLKKVDIQDLLVMQLKYGLRGMCRREISLQRRESNTINIELAKILPKIDREGFIVEDERRLNGFLKVGFIALSFCVCNIIIDILRHQFNISIDLILFAIIPTAIIYKWIKDKRQNQRYLQMIEDTQTIIDTQQNEKRK